MAGKITAVLVLTLTICFISAPEGIDPRGMHIAGIFAGTILGLILQPLPTASAAPIGLADLVLSPATPSNTSLVGAAIATGAPPLFTALALGFIGNLIGDEWMPVLGMLG